MASLPPVSLSSRLLMVLALVGIAGGFHLTGIAANAQAPLAAVTGLEVVGELRPGTPNLPLLLVVQWDEVEGADRYELERADTPPPGAERAYEPVATLTGADRRPNGKIGYVDEAGFAFAGGDCFRVRALRGTEVGEWAETCLPIPPSDGPGPPGPDDFAFRVEFTPDYEFTVISWRAEGDAYGPFTLTRRGTFVPLAVVPEQGGPHRIRLVFPRLNGCFRLEAPRMEPIESQCYPFPTDLGALDLPERVLPIDAPVVVRATGRQEAPVVVAWRASGGPTDLLFRVDRGYDEWYEEAASLSYAGATLDSGTPGTMVFLDSSPFLGERQCYRVTAVSSAGESLIGEGCRQDGAPGPPDAGSGARGDTNSPPREVMLFGFLLMGFGLLTRPALRR